jgi:hypothetical protein
MQILDEQFVHSLLATPVRLMVFDDSQGHFLVLEDWDGPTTPVRKTVGSFDTREAALARVSEREVELRDQRFTRTAAES